jgi:type II secretory pathway pseudopilin PulG
MVEVLIVVVIAGVLAMLAVPKMRATIEKNDVRAVRQKIEVMVGTARAAGIHKGRQSAFWTSGNWVSVWTINPATNAWEPLIPWEYLPSAYPKVSLQLGGSAYPAVWYDKRGIVLYRPATTMVFRVVHSSGISDSLCVTRLGQVLPRSCTL